MGNLVWEEDPLAAAQYYNAAIEIFEELVNEMPSNAPLQRDLASALGSAEEALRIFAELASEDRGAGPLRDLALIYSSIGELHRAAAETAASGRGCHLRESANAYSESLRLWRELSGRGILRPADQSKPDDVERDLNDARRALEGA